MFLINSRRVSATAGRIKNNNELREELSTRLLISGSHVLFSDFNQDGRPDNISFMIKRVKVHSGDALRDPNYRFPGNYGVEKYLELFSGEYISLLYSGALMNGAAECHLCAQFK